MPAAVLARSDVERELGQVTGVMIGIDPRKASHTAVAIDEAEAVPGELRVRASAGQAGRLVAWAAGWPDRVWAVEGAGGRRYLLAWRPCSDGPVLRPARTHAGRWHWPAWSAEAGCISGRRRAGQ
jgi:hypothetical protein